jgi:hypothetical protein
MHTEPVLDSLEKCKEARAEEDTMKALPNVQTGGGFSQSIAHLWICSEGKRRPIDSQTAP